MNTCAPLHLPKTGSDFILSRSLILFSPIRFIPVVAFALSQAAFAQKLPTPAAEEKPKVETAAPRVTVHTDVPKASDKTSDVPAWLNQPPVRATQPGSEVIIVTPDTPAFKIPSASVGGISIYGLSDQEAYRKLKANLDSRLEETITLDDGTKQWTTTRERAGISIPYAALIRQARQNKGDVPLRFEVNSAAAQKLMRGIAAKADYAKISVPASVMRLQAALQKTPPSSYIKLIALRLPEPPKSATPDSGLAKFPYVLAEFSSRYDASLRGRTNNLRMAAKLVNGTVVPEGGVFSANKAIGPRNAADGWREAHMFVSGQVVNGVGAGICQCSSTIYNAALLAGLPIVERHPHMFRVTYVPASRDAAIYWGGKDFRFRNNTGGAIYVQTFLKGGRFHARLLGTQPRRGSFAVESRVVSRKKGTLSEAYRVARIGAEEVKEKLSRDYYRPKPE
jgi:hypothetical protein